jgi:hypothetical protein
MEQIPKDVIEMAEDFINHLSLNQQGDLLINFFYEQLYISEIIIKSHKGMKDQEQAMKCNFLLMLIFKCYKYYGIKIPVISREIIKSTQEQYSKLYHLMQTKKQNYRELFNEFKTIIKQDNLLDFMILKLEGTPENLVSYQAEYDKNVSVNEMILVILCLNNEMMKHIGDGIN